MKLTIIGASGHGRVVADIAEKLGYNEITFLDDNGGLDSCGKWPVRGETALAEQTDGDIFVAIGNAAIRKRITERLAGKNLVTLIHPDAVISNNGVEIGGGTVIMAGAVINPYVSIGSGCIINTCSSVDHNCVLGDYVHVSVGAHVSGTVNIGDMTWVGAGAVVSNNVDICGGCMIGAGAAVVRNVEKPGTYVGVPARKIKD